MQSAVQEGYHFNPGGNLQKHNETNKGLSKGRWYLWRIFFAHNFWGEAPTCLSIWNLNCTMTWNTYRYHWSGAEFETFLSCIMHGSCILRNGTGIVYGGWVKIWQSLTMNLSKVSIFISASEYFQRYVQCHGKRPWKFGQVVFRTVSYSLQ